MCVILIVLNNFKNDSRVLKEALSLKKKGYNVRVVAIWEPGLKEKENICGIPVHRIKLFTKHWPKNKVIQLIKYLEFLVKFVKFYRKSDILHCNDLGTLPIGVFIKKFLNRKAKIVYDAHEYEINDVPNENKFKIKLKYFLEKTLIKYADKTITVSESIAKEYSRLYGINKPYVILNVPTYQEINTKTNLLREKLGIDESKKIFLYQGGLSSGRGIELILDAFEKMENNNAVAVFMGYGPLEKLIKSKAKNSKKIFFLPAVPPNEVLKYTASADYGFSLIEDICLSYKYCLPNKLFEYLMAEIPVIVSNLPEQKKIVEKYKVGVVVRENTPEGLREAVGEILRLDRDELVRNIKKVKKFFNWENQEKILLNVYRDL